MIFGWGGKERGVFRWFKREEEQQREGEVRGGTTIKET